MVLTIINQTSNERLYLSATVAIPANSPYTATSTQIFPLSRDSGLIYDCVNQSVNLTDGINIYIGSDAINYLNNVASSLGGAVVGFIGTPAPNFAITVGGKDPNGNVTVGSFDSNSSLKTSDVLNISSQYRAQSVTTSAAEATGAASRLTNRKFISITPTNGTVYWGTSNSVTTSSGSPLFPNNTLFLSFTDNVPVYLISAGTVDVRILEGS